MADEPPRPASLTLIFAGSPGYDGSIIPVVTTIH